MSEAKDVFFNIYSLFFTTCYLLPCIDRVQIGYRQGIATNLSVSKIEQDLYDLLKSHVVIDKETAETGAEEMKHEIDDNFHENHGRQKNGDS